MKGLILCAGKGSRLQPISFSQPKTLLPVANKPVLYYCIENLVKEGIRDIGIVINQSQEQIMKETLGSGEAFGATLTYIYQHQPKGIAHAVKQAESFIEQDLFLLILGDNLIQELFAKLKVSIQHPDINCSVMIAKVKNPQDYGVAEIQGDRIIGLEEKPKHPKSDHAVIGAYAFDSTIFQAIHAITPSSRGEYEITDAIQWLIDYKYNVSYSTTKSYYSDVGTVDRWLEANRWMLDLKTKNNHQLTNHSYDNCTIIPPVNIAEGCQLKDSTIGPYVSIAPRAKIEGCTIENSIILEDVHLKHITHKINNSIFGKSTRVHRDYEEQEGFIQYILGDKSSVTVHEVEQMRQQGGGGIGKKRLYK